ncbi:MAG: hypothetical protein DWQ08_15520, partial [Proteobacteria bacterium]
MPDGEIDRRRAVVTGNDTKTRAGETIQHQWQVGLEEAAPQSAHGNRVAPRGHVVERRRAGGIGYVTGGRERRGSTKPLDHANVGGELRTSQHLVEHARAGIDHDRESIARRCKQQVIHAHGSRRTGAILDDDFGFARKMAPDVPSDDARIEVGAATGGVRHDNGYGFALEIRRRAPADHQSASRNHQQCDGARETSSQPAGDATTPRMVQKTRHCNLSPPNEPRWVRIRTETPMIRACTGCARPWLYSRLFETLHSSKTRVNRPPVMPIETRDAQKTSAAPRRTRDTIAPPHLDRLPDWQLERRSLSLAPDAEFEPIDDRVAATSLWARLHDMIDRYPGHCAVRSHDRAITFEQLGGICARAAHGLSSRIAPHAIIGLYFDFEVEAYAAVATSILAGHPFVFIDAALPDARVRYLVDDAGVELVLTCDRLAFRAMAAATTAPVVTIEESAAGGSAAYTGVERGPDDLACLTYTSGTTGDPCGAIRSDGSFLAGLSWSINALGINSRDVTVITSFGTAASTAYMVTGMLTGSGVLLHNVRRHGISRLAARLREERATLLYMPSHLLRVFSRTLPGGSRFPDLRIVRSHADSCLPSDVERFYECFARHTTLVNGLANSEAMSISIYFTSADDRYDDGRVPVGYPIGDVDVRIEDARGNRVDCGTPGEIVVSGRCIAPGYHGGREAATGKIAADPGRPDRYRLHTGDLGYQLDDGQLVHAGRLGSWTKVRGYRVQLEEIARAVRDLPGVDDVHLRVSTLESGHEGIVAY